MKCPKMYLFLLLGALLCSMGISAHATDFPLTVTIDTQDLGTKGINQSASATQSADVTGIPAEPGTTSAALSVEENNATQQPDGEVKGVAGTPINMGKNNDWVQISYSLTRIIHNICNSSTSVIISAR